MRNFKNYFIVIISAFLFHTRIAAALINNTAVQSDSLSKKVDLSKKAYYEQVFNKDERKLLKKAYSTNESANKYMLDYETDRKEIDMLYTIAEATSSPKSRDKSLTRARKLEQKSMKKGIKALDLYYNSTKTKREIYVSAINRIRLNDGTIFSKLGKELELQSKENFEKAKTLRDNVPQHDEQLNFNVSNDANNAELTALNFMEHAIALYQKDAEIDLEDYSAYYKPDEEVVDNKQKISKIEVGDSSLFPVKVQPYNPISDPGLYKSNADIILKKIKLNENEAKLIAEGNRKTKYANDLMKQVDEAYVLVDSLNALADKTPDFKTRDKIRNNAIEKEQAAFYKLTNATNIYLDVNETRYKIYNDHFPKDVDKNKNPELIKAKGYEKDAETYYQKAKTEIAIAKKQMYRSEQYIQLMGANDMLLYAIQLQESAYGIYLNVPNILVGNTDTAFVTKNTKITGTQTLDKDKTIKLNEQNASSTFTYSMEKPKAVPYKKKTGVIFTVQIGLFKGVVPAEKFGIVQPVIFEEFMKYPGRRYMAGEYRSTEAVEVALELIKKAGYTDAFIISLIDGERKTYADGKNKVNTGDENYTVFKNNELEKLSVKSGKQEQIIHDDKIKTGLVQENSIKNVPGLVYLVQLGMYLKPLTYAELKNLQPIYTDKIPDKGTRYMVGLYTTLAKAREETLRAIDAGMKDAYVIAYYNGGNITLEKAQKLEASGLNQQNTKNEKSDTEIMYMVQVGAYKNKLNTEEEIKLRNDYKNQSIEYRSVENMNLYLIGKYKSYKEADFLKKKLISEGHTSVFVVAFHGDKKIPVGEAIKLNNRM